mgnify:CR=1 FL=1
MIVKTITITCKVKDSCKDTHGRYIITFEKRPITIDSKYFVFVSSSMHNQLPNLNDLINFEEIEEITIKNK